MNVRAHALALLVACSCAPAWSDEPALIAEPRIIAVTADPPEAAPGATVRLTAVAATREGPAALPVEWSFCRTPKPLGENGAVHPVCVTGILPPLAAPAPAVEAPLPAEGCRLFGPETPPRSGDDPLPRPRDPDSTGGYYQPVRASGVGEVSFASVRLLCNLPSAPIEVAVDLRQRYRRNENPPAPEVVAIVDDLPVPLHALPPGRPVTLIARWPPAAAESYLAFDPVSQAVVERREAMWVSWFVSAGTVDRPRTGRREDDHETAVTAVWRESSPLPSGARWHVWAVLQDSRGGTAVSHRELSRPPPQRSVAFISCRRPRGIPARLRWHGCAARPALESRRLPAAWPGSTGRP